MHPPTTRISTHSAPRRGTQRVVRLALALAASLTLLGGCARQTAALPAPFPNTETPPFPGDNPCNAQAALAVVQGKRANPALAQQARIAAGAKTVRTLHKNAIITQEYLGSRLNLITNDAGVIESARCG